jgi:hypothetical protein
MNKCIRLVLSIVLTCFALATLATAATEQDKLAAIQSGLANLAATQQPDGSWYYGGYEPAVTGAAVLAFMSQKNNWGGINYQPVADNAMAYLLANATTNTVSTRDDGVNICPGGTGSCTGVYWYGAGESTYTTGLIAPAIAFYAAGNPNGVATTTGPLAGMTWSQIAQGITNEFAAAQCSAIDGYRDGGWRYYFGERDADSSTTQWAVASMIFDETLGAVTPSTIKDHLKVRLANTQAPDGSACYVPGSQPCDHADTGGMLLGLHFVGYDLSNAQMLAALGFLNTNWPQLANGTWYGNFAHPYAMWAVYKGMDVTITTKDTTYITNLLTDCGKARGHLPNGPCNWWEDYNEWLALNQNGDGSWTGYAYWYGPLATSFDVNILGATPVQSKSCIDYSPSSIDFGNVYLNRKKKEVLTLTNNCTTKQTIGAVSFTNISGNPADFSFHKYCNDAHGGGLRVGQSCMVQVFFSPAEVGPNTATLNVVTSAPPSPLQVPVTAAGIKKK